MCVEPIKYIHLIYVNCIYIYIGYAYIKTLTRSPKMVPNPMCNMRTYSELDYKYC